MAMSLTPREIQQRIRSGATAEEVAGEAGVAVEQIASFIGPALAERGFYLKQAQQAPLRRAGQTAGYRPLQTVVSERIATMPDAKPEWDAYQQERGKWVISVTLLGRQAEFIYQQSGRFSVAGNPDAHWLIGDPTIENPSHLGTPNSQLLPTPEADIETPNIAANTTPAVTPAPAPRKPLLSDSMIIDMNAEVEALPVPEDLDDQPYEPTISLVAPGDDDAELSDITDAFTEAEFREIDGVMDLTSKESNTDVIYEILATMNEDSVKLYNGIMEAQGSRNDSAVANPVAPTAAPTKPESATLPGAKTPVWQAPGDTATPPQPTDSPNVNLPQQPSLIDAPARPPRKKRASVPSWDEIMFGGN